MFLMYAFTMSVMVFRWDKSPFDKIILKVLLIVCLVVKSFIVGIY